MPQLSLESFKSSIIDFARPNRFYVYIDDTDWDEEYGYLVKSASLPSRTIGDIDIKWQGMTYHIPGDPSFENFSITFLNDIDFDVKNYFESWFEMMAEMETNERMTHEEVNVTIVVQQLNGKGEFVKQYRLFNCHPIQMDAIELDQDTENTIETFVVTFSYSHFETDNVEE